MAARADLIRPRVRVLTDLFRTCLRRDWRNAFIAERLLFGLGTTFLRVRFGRRSIVAQAAAAHNTPAQDAIANWARGLAPSP